MPQQNVAHLIQELKRKDGGRRANAALELGETGDPTAVLPLCQALREWSQREDELERVPQAVATALVKLGEPSVLPLCGVVEIGNVEAREWAVEALARLADPRAVQALAVALRDERLWNGRRKAAEALGRIGSPAVEALCEALWDLRPGVRCLAAATLSRIGDRRALRTLCDALRDRNWSVRCLAASALGQIGDPGAVPALCEALRRGGPDLRRHAAAALGRIGDPRAVLPLFDAREDEDASVRPRITEALNRIVLQEPAAEALVQLGAPAVLPLCEILRDNNAEARCQAARVLTQIAEREAAPALRAAVPPLRRLLSPWRLTDDSEADVYRIALERIEAATRSMDLPLPAAPPPLCPESLPIPAIPPAPETDHLPIPACDPPPLPDSPSPLPSAVGRVQRHLNAFWKWLTGAWKGRRRSSYLH